MSHSVSLSKSAIKFSLLASAIAGSVVAVSSLPSASLMQSQVIQVPVYRSAPAELPESDRIAVMATAFGGAVAVSLGLNAILDRKRPTQAGSLRQSGTVTFDQVSSSLQRKLLRLLHDDRGAAARLFAQARLKYAGKSPDWYAEKVIFDLERDRGRY